MRELTPVTKPVQTVTGAKPTSTGNPPSRSAPTGGWRNVILGGRAVNTTAKFGQRGSVWSKGWHTGQDFGAPRGTPVNAPMAGTVVSAGWGGPYGNTVLIRLTNGDYMRFAHLDKIAVSTGQKIAAGRYVGAVGSTGTNSSGPHLHMEVMTAKSGGNFNAANAFMDPVKYLAGQRVSAKPEAATGGTTFTEVGLDGTSGSGVSGGMKVPGFKKSDFYAKLAANFGSVDTLLQMDKEARAEVGGKSIKWAIDKMVKDKIVDPTIMQTYLEQTGWYKKYGVDTTKRLAAERNRDGVFQNEVENTAETLRAGLRETGVTISDEALNQIARNAYVYGWSGERAMQTLRESASLNFDGRKDMLTSKFNELGVQVSEAALQRLASASWIYGWTDESLIDEVQNLAPEEVSYSGGRIGAGLDEMAVFADDFGVNMTDADIRQYRNDFLDNVGDQRVKESLQERAAQTYAVFADKIRAGQSTKSLASAYFQKAAELLEVDPNAIKWDDPLFTGGKAFTGVDEKGQQIVKGLWDFEKEIRKDARWMETQNAKDEAMGTAAGVLKMMGLA